PDPAVPSDEPPEREEAIPARKEIGMMSRLRERRTLCPAVAARVVDVQPVGEAERIPGDVRRQAAGEIDPTAVDRRVDFLNAIGNRGPGLPPSAHVPAPGLL